MLDHNTRILCNYLFSLIILSSTFLLGIEVSLYSQLDPESENTLTFFARLFILSLKATLGFIRLLFATQIWTTLPPPNICCFKRPFCGCSLQLASHTLYIFRNLPGVLISIRRPTKSPHSNPTPAHFCNKTFLV